MERLVVFEEEYDFTNEKGVETADWYYCSQAASFSHRDACEFILWVPRERKMFEEVKKGMEEYGCTDQFLNTYEEAFNKKANWLLLYS